MADIVERLRDPKVYIPGEELLHEAADEITRLRSERSNLIGTVRLHKERAEALIARVEELEAALRPLACTCEAESQDECSRSEKHCPFWNALAALTKGEKQPAYTEGHCAHKKAPGGCQLHNIYCGYPDCDRRAIIKGESND